MEKTTFSAVGINQTFAIVNGSDVFEPESETVWCNKIDDARYIHIGQNGAYIPNRDMVVFIESK